MVDENYYVYIYLDPRKKGNYIYGEYKFDYEPIYVGKGHGNRKDVHLKYKCRNDHFNKKIQKIKREINNEPLVILYRNWMTEEEALKLEEKIISTIGRYDLKKGSLCNHTNGGEGHSGYIKSKETRLKLSKAAKGRILTEEHKQRIRISNTGKSRTVEQKKRISDAHKGIKQSKETIEKRTLHLIGIPCSDDKKQKISSANKGKRRSEETKRKLSIAKTGIPCPEITKISVSNAHKGIPRTEETKRKISETLKNKNKIKLNK